MRPGPVNTSYVERLNLTIRRSLACLQRRTTALLRSKQKLEQQVVLLQCYYNFVRPHSSLKFGPERRTPAMQAGLVGRRLTLREIFLSSCPDGIPVSWGPGQLGRQWGATRHLRTAA